MFSVTSDRAFEVFPDATFVGAADWFADPLGEEIDRGRDLAVTRQWETEVWSTFGQPAASLPEIDPSPAELNALAQAPFEMFDEYLAELDTAAVRALTEFEHGVHPDPFTGEIPAAVVVELPVRHSMAMARPA